ncbi:hypothetical protein OZX72_02065 [Bifidobacterium sp. ESL0769]|uniref:hypothetical protein n=1 Tax=Bifidobacterium sp. ESL0769 TaxID=2983229 RepID=UPI0023F8E668|nr:hypothetical protein [Bifidobacterium sp. ESL0769]WEV67805.1 hypothetical protein OZX72_02065 [Bifidobacterium sp. ESL0769]
MSGVVVLVILVILILGWLPRRTADSMKRVVEHREDKYSPSLHLVDADSGTRFSDRRQPSAKGIVMQSERKNITASPAGAPVARPTKAMKERARVAHIRKLRREAARRRAMISAALLVVTVVVFAVSFPLKFSALFALIPATLLAVVVALGVRTANHARAWEHDLKVKRAAQAKAHKAQGKSSAVANGQVANSSNSSAQVAAQYSATPLSSDEQPTGLMAEREIQKAVEQSRAEKERIEIRRAAQSQAEARQKKAKLQAVKKDADVAAASSQAVNVAGSAKSVSQTKRPAEQGKAQSASARKPNPHAANAAASAKKKTSKSANNRRQNATAAGSGKMNTVNTAAKKQRIEPNDATNELQQVHPAQALDVVDLAPNQDLISFSLGAPRNGVEVRNEEPKSLEIKSTRQVAKAKAKAPAKGMETTSSSASKHTKKIADQSVGNKGEDSNSSVSHVAETQAESNSTEASTGPLISKKNRKRARAMARRARAAAQRDGKVKREKPTYTSDPEKFHASEVSADTEAPAVSSDSLGTGLEKILERRNV